LLLAPVGLGFEKEQTVFASARDGVSQGARVYRVKVRPADTLLAKGEHADRGASSTSPGSTKGRSFDGVVWGGEL
jgi:hypothetical protein